MEGYLAINGIRAVRGDTFKEVVDIAKLMEGYVLRFRGVFLAVDWTDHKNMLAQFREEAEVRCCFKREASA